MVQDRFRRAALWRLIAACALLYTAVHFVVSGVMLPINKPKTAPFSEAAPLVTYMAEGGEVRSTNPRQYGPAFFFVMHPLLRLCHRCIEDQYTRSYVLYGVQLVTLAIAFACCFGVLRRWIDEVKERRHLDDRPMSDAGLLLLLTLLWFNFSPLYYMMTTKNVETWELSLIAIGLYCYLRGWRFSTAMCIAAAAMMKMLPLFFLIYFLVRDRRTFVYCCASLLIIMTVSQLLYGWQMGYGYLPFMLRAAVGKTFALTWHENVSLKGQIVKAFAQWRLVEEPGNGFWLAISDEQLALPNLIGQIVQVGGVLWMIWALASLGRHGTESIGQILWGWSLTNTLMLILAPAVPFEYTVLLLLVFSVVVVGVAITRELHADRVTLSCVCGAVLLVANVIPRQLLNRLLPLGTLSRWSGNETLINPSEAYQHYGFPLLGMFLLLAALWRLRRYMLDVEVTPRVIDAARLSSVAAP